MEKQWIDHLNSVPKVQQVVNLIRYDIDRGSLVGGQKLLSISRFAKTHKIARDTVEKAYRRLQAQGYIESVPGKGNYVTRDENSAINILLIFNKLSSYKKEVYYSFIDTLGEKARVDLQIHHYNPEILRDILRKSLGVYHYYVVMPHFFHDTSTHFLESVFKTVPEESLILLDYNPNLVEVNYASVYQDFKQDIYEGLCEGLHLIRKYKGITVIFPELSNHPLETLEGIKQFCIEQNKKYVKLSNIKSAKIERGQVYITLTESELADLVKEIRASGLTAGSDVGIISFNETVLKELLNITVISSDFKYMGAKAAKMILEKNFSSERNPSNFIIRQSL